MNICESYKVICGAIIIGLKSLGIDAETGNGKAEISLRTERVSSMFC